MADDDLSTLYREAKPFRLWPDPSEERRVAQWRLAAALASYPCVAEPRTPPRGLGRLGLLFDRVRRANGIVTRSETYWSLDDKRRRRLTLGMALLTWPVFCMIAAVVGVSHTYPRWLVFASYGVIWATAIAQLFSPRVRACRDGIEVEQDLRGYFVPWHQIGGAEWLSASATTAVVRLRDRQGRSLVRFRAGRYGIDVLRACEETQRQLREVAAAHRQGGPFRSAE